MAPYPIVNRNDRPLATAGHRQLPDFYMEDFSVIGFRVNDCDHAVRVLDQHAFALRRSNGSITVEINRASQMHEAMKLLNDNGLQCELADVAEGIYQG